jgi:hypothetical protein
MAAENAEVEKNIATTSDFMFLGAFVNAYSMPVIHAKISESAMRIYDPLWTQTLREEVIRFPLAPLHLDAKSPQGLVLSTAKEDQITSRRQT